MFRLRENYERNIPQEYLYRQSPMDMTAVLCLTLTLTE